MFTISKIMAEGEMEEEEAPDPGEVFERIKLLEARALIRERLDVTDYEIEMIRDAAEKPLMELTLAGRLVVKMAEALGMV